MIYLLADAADTLNKITGYIGGGWFAYLVLFGLLFSCGLGMPIPEDVPLVAAGILIAQGQMHVVPACILAWMGIIGGDCVLYSLGRKYGLNITRVPFIGKHVTRDRIVYAENLFAKYGFLVVAVGRLVAVIRGAMVVAAGSIRYNVAKFIFADGVAALVSGGMFIWLGHAGAKNIKMLAEQIHRYSMYLVIAVIVIIGIFVARLVMNKNKQPVHAVDAKPGDDQTQAASDPLHDGSAD